MHADFASFADLPAQRYNQRRSLPAYWHRRISGRLAARTNMHLLHGTTSQDPRTSHARATSLPIGLIPLPAPIFGALACKNGVSAPIGGVQFGGPAQHLVRERPDLAAELYKPQPFDMRGEQKPGSRGCTNCRVPRLDGRLSPADRAYILASQRHPDGRFSPTPPVKRSTDAAARRRPLSVIRFPAGTCNSQTTTMCSGGVHGRSCRRKGSPSQSGCGWKTDALPIAGLFPQQHLQPLAQKAGDQPT